MSGQPAPGGAAPSSSSSGQPSTSAGANPSSSSGSLSPLDLLEQQLERSVENVRQIRIVVADFQPQGQPGLNQKLQQVVRDLGEVDRLRPRLRDVQVPLEVFDYVDAGRNPHFYTRDCMERALARNEEEKGKIDAYRLFKARLLGELSQTFPKQMASYRAVRGDERVNP